MVAAGRVKLIKHTAEGRGVILHVVGPGDWFGGVAAFGRRPHPFTAQTMESTTILEILGTDFAALMDRYPAVANQVIQELVERLTEAHEMMTRLTMAPVERRLAHTLLQLSGKMGHSHSNGVTIDVPLTRQDIAEMAGTTVETTIRVLSRWRKQGVIQMEGGRVVITDRERLKRIAMEC
jgi:CRP/FNR family transcriptional regulator